MVFYSRACLFSILWLLWTESLNKKNKTWRLSNDVCYKVCDYHLINTAHIPRCLRLSWTTFTVIYELWNYHLTVNYSACSRPFISFKFITEGKEILILSMTMLILTENWNAYLPKRIFLLDALQLHAVLNRSSCIYFGHTIRMCFYDILWTNYLSYSFHKFASVYVKCLKEMLLIVLLTHMWTYAIICK